MRNFTLKSFSQSAINNSNLDFYEELLANNLEDASIASAWKPTHSTVKDNKIRRHTTLVAGNVHVQVREDK